MTQPELGLVGVPAPAYRLPAATRVGVVRLQVADLARSLAWYERVLGLRALDHGAGIARLGSRDEGRPLVELHERAGAAPVPSRGRLGLYHYALLLPHRAALGRLVAHLASIGERIGASDHLVSEALYLHDPDGLGIEVYADRPRGEWRTDGGEIQMDTRPLDADAVMRAGGGVPWSGMPAGTTMGHVHLHVGDVDAAARFYHAALGLDKVVWSYRSALFLSAGGYHHHLGINSWAGAGAVPPAEGDARLLEWTLLVPTPHDVAAVSASLAGAGHPVADARVRDPWGTTLHLRPADAD